MTDIKQTLGTAFDGEPPLTIDTAKIVRAGRRRVSVRRAGTAVAALVTATVVCVPAMLGSSGGGGTVDVAGQRTTVTLTTTATTSLPATTTSGPGAGVPSSASQPTPPRPVTEERARQLTDLLAGSGAIPEGRFSAVPGDPMPPWRFTPRLHSYLTITEVTTSAGRGSVMMNLSPSGAPSCSPEDGCEERQYDGKTVHVHRSSHNGVHVLTVDLVTPDGALLHVQATNSSNKADANGGGLPLTWEQLAKLATVPGLTF